MHLLSYLLKHISKYKFAIFVKNSIKGTFVSCKVSCQIRNSFVKYLIDLVVAQIFHSNNGNVGLLDYMIILFPVRLVILQFPIKWYEKKKKSWYITFWKVLREGILFEYGFFLTQLHLLLYLLKV